MVALRVRNHQACVILLVPRLVLQLPDVHPACVLGIPISVLNLDGDVLACNFHVERRADPSAGVKFHDPILAPRRFVLKGMLVHLGPHLGLPTFGVTPSIDPNMGTDNHLRFPGRHLSLADSLAEWR